MFKDLHGHPVLRRNVQTVGYVGSVHSPQMVGFMKSINLWNKKRTDLLLMWMRLGRRRVLTITVGNKVGVDVPEEQKWRRRPRSKVLEVILGQPQVLTFLRESTKSHNER